MIRLSSQHKQEIFAQGLREKPYEACGYLVGKAGVVHEVIPMTNVDHSEEHFSLDPKEQFAVVKKVRADQREILAVYHTHPASGARPSEEDIRLAFDPTMIYVIGSLLTDEFDLKAFYIQNGQVQPVPLEEIPNASY
ncbi:MAG: M67 family metallopeptidase [Candidatus Margulisiibacteriota bacterium]